MQALRDYQWVSWFDQDSGIVRSLWRHKELDRNDQALIYFFFNKLINNKGGGRSPHVKNPSISVKPFDLFG